jgi:hypothetical protein
MPLFNEGLLFNGGLLGGGNRPGRWEDSRESISAFIQITVDETIVFSDASVFRQKLTVQW